METPRRPRRKGPQRMLAEGVESLFSSSTEAETRKEEWKDATTRLVNALKAVEEPMLIRARSRLTTMVEPIDHSGRAVWGSIYQICVNNLVHTRDRVSKAPLPNESNAYSGQMGGSGKASFPSKSPRHPRTGCQTPDDSEYYGGNDHRTLIPLALRFDTVLDQFGLDGN